MLLQYYLYVYNLNECMQNIMLWASSLDFNKIAPLRSSQELTNTFYVRWDIVLKKHKYNSDVLTPSQTCHLFV